MKVLTSDNVKLSKVKLINGGGIEITYQEIVRDGDMEFKEDYIKKSSINPHPDLVNKLNELKTFLLRCYNVASIDVVRKSTQLTIKEKEGFKAVKKIIDAMIVENNKKTTIGGVSINGDAGKQSIIIMGKQLQANKSKTALNSPRIPLHQTTFGFEGEIDVIIEDLKEEVHAYLFDNKKAHLDMFDEPKLDEDFIEGDMEAAQKEAV